MKSRNRIVYSIDVDDIQNVADQELHRDLTNKEINSLKIDLVIILTGMAQ